MTIGDAADHFGVSKEAIHNRIRRGSLESIVENGIKYVAVASSKTPPAEAEDTRYTQYIEAENVRLRDKVDGLEKETARLRDQRELMLIDQRISVEQIYKERDAQLRNILNVVATKFLSHVNPDLVVKEALKEESLPQMEAINADIVPDIQKEKGWISLKEFFKLKRYGESLKKNIKRRFKAAAYEGDERFIEHGEKVFLNPSLHDYSDLLSGR